MREPLVIALRRNGMKLPRRGRIFPIGFRIPKEAARAANNLWFAIAINVRKSGRFVVNHIENDMLLPVTFAAARIFVPGSFFARETVNHNVGPTVAIKIVREREKIIGVSVIDAERALEAREVFFGAIGLLAFESRIGRIELVAIGEAGSFIPI